MSPRPHLREGQRIAVWGVFCGVVLAYFAWVGHSMPLAMWVLIVVTFFKP